jgi:hypothetical protein
MGFGHQANLARRWPARRLSTPARATDGNAYGKGGTKAHKSDGKKIRNPLEAAAESDGGLTALRLMTIGQALSHFYRGCRPAFASARCRQLLNRTYAASGKNVAELVQHMAKLNLRFAPALEGDEQAYKVLHQALAKSDVAVHEHQVARK